MSNLRSEQANKTTRLPLSLSPTTYRVRVKAGDNWVVPGRKGSGKTVFFKELINQLHGLYPYSHVYILDIKHRDFNDYQGRISSDTAPALISTTPSASDPESWMQVWQPVRRVPEEIESWLGNILNDAPAIVGIDEGVALQYTRNWKSETFEAMQKLGRDLPITTVVATQDLVKMPHSILSQADHAVRFTIRHPYEKSLLKSVLGVLHEPVDRHGFWYCNVEDGGMPIYYSDMQSFFGLAKS